MVFFLNGGKWNGIFFTKPPLSSLKLTINERLLLKLHYIHTKTT